MALIDIAAICLAKTIFKDQIICERILKKCEI